MVTTAHREPPVDDDSGGSDPALAPLCRVDDPHRRDPDVVARLRELDEMKTTFLGAVSHELRTTVTIIEGFAMLLRRQWSDLDEQQRTDFVDRIWLSSRSLGTLIEDLLDLARLDKSGSGIVLQHLDLSTLVGKVVEQTAGRLMPHPVTVDTLPSVRAWADPVALERIVVNLLSNASKHTPPATPIAVTVAIEEDKAVVRVADHGPGIPVGERERIFERFYRGESGCNSAGRGLGIGLAVTRDLVDQLGWCVSVVDTPGGGATFEVWIPPSAPFHS